MIKRIDKNRVECSDGWKLSFLGDSPLTWKILYQERDRHIEISVEGGVDKEIFFYVYLSAIQKWMPEVQNKLISPSEKERIGQNIRLGLKTLDISCRVA